MGLLCGSSVFSPELGLWLGLEALPCWKDSQSVGVSGWVDRRLHSGARHLGCSYIFSFPPDSSEKGIYDWQTFF